MGRAVSPEQPTRRKPGRPPKPGTKPWLLELAPDVAALVEAHKAAMGVSRTAALEDLVRKAMLDDLGDAVDHAIGADGVCVCGAADCRAVSP